MTRIAYPESIVRLPTTCPVNAILPLDCVYLVATNRTLHDRYYGSLG